MLCRYVLLLKRWRASEEYLYKYFGCQQRKLVLGSGNTFVISGLQSQLLHPLALLPRQEMGDTNTDFDTILHEELLVTVIILRHFQSRYDETTLCATRDSGVRNYTVVKLEGSVSH